MPKTAPKTDLKGRVHVILTVPFSLFTLASDAFSIRLKAGAYPSAQK